VFVNVICQSLDFLGCQVEIGVMVSKNSSHLDSYRAIELAFSEIKTVHEVCSFRSHLSDLYRLNTHIADWVTVHPYLFDLIQKAKRFMIDSEHSFNCMCGVRWIKQGLLPHHAHVKNHYLEQGDANDILIRGKDIMIARKCQMCLNGIAKGYAIDRAVESLIRHGISAAWLKAGGDMRVYGSLEIPIEIPWGQRMTKRIGHLCYSALATSYLNDVGEAIRSTKPIYHEGPPMPIMVRADYGWMADALTKVAATASEAVLQKVFDQYQAHVLTVQ
jgi:thiamine biosynthesis lipoprotein